MKCGTNQRGQEGPSLKKNGQHNFYVQYGDMEAQEFGGKRIEPRMLSERIVQDCHMWMQYG